jgi:protein-S-isoprenylcysteine O-methyltransferase Ste14
MDPLASILPLLMTLAVRQVMESALRRGAPSKKSGSDKASIVCWYLVYSTILALALLRIWEMPVMAQAWWGYAVLWSGIALRLVSLREIGAYYHPLVLIRQGHRLVDTGPYCCLRHPLHLGLHLEMAGLALLAADVLARRNLQEERVLEGFFGPAYGDYRRHTWDLVDLLPGARRS